MYLIAHYVTEDTGMVFFSSICIFSMFFILMELMDCSQYCNIIPLAWLGGGGLKHPEMLPKQVFYAPYLVYCKPCTLTLLFSPHFFSPPSLLSFVGEAGQHGGVLFLCREVHRNSFSGHFPKPAQHLPQHCKVGSER